MNRQTIRGLALPFLVAVAGCGAVVASGAVSPPQWPTVLVAGMYVAVMSDRLRGLLRSRRMSFLPTEIPLVVGLLIASPTDMLVGLALGAGFVLILNRRRAPVRAFFNGFMGIGFFALSSVVFHQLALDGISDPRTWAACLALAIAVEVLSELVIAIGVNIGTRQWKPDFLQAVRTGPSLTVTNASLILVGVLLIQVHPLAAGLILPAVVAFAKAYRAQLRQSDDSRRLGLMNLASQLAPTSNQPIDRAGLLSLIAAAMSADFVAVVVSALAPSRDVWEFGVVEDGAESLDLRLGEGVHSLTAIELSKLSAEHRARTWRTGLAARLVDGDTDFGWVAVARGSDANPAPFDEIDRRMFGLMATVITGLLSRGALIGEVAELDEQTALLRHRASHDGMTLAVSAQEFRSRLVEAVKRTPGRAALFYLDLDGFKPVNDRHGHAAGDAVLVEVASRLRACVRAGDIVGRIGGDEFAIIASVGDTTSLDDIADRLLHAVRKPIQFEGIALQVSASIGVTLLGGADAAAALAAADGAMYRAKVEGGGAWRVAEAIPTF